MRAVTKIAIVYPLACSLAMYTAIVFGTALTIRSVMLLTSLTSLMLGFSMSRWPVPEAPRWQIWPMARSWLGLVVMALLLLPLGYIAPIKGAGALCLLSLLPAEVARWAGNYSHALHRLHKL